MSEDLGVCAGGAQLAEKTDTVKHMGGCKGIVFFFFFNLVFKFRKVCFV